MESISGYSFASISLPVKIIQKKKKKSILFVEIALDHV